jgi:hypothetical protein
LCPKYSFIFYDLIIAKLKEKINKKSALLGRFKELSIIKTTAFIALFDRTFFCLIIPSRSADHGQSPARVIFRSHDNNIAAAMTLLTSVAFFRSPAPNPGTLKRHGCSLLF